MTYEEYYNQWQLSTESRDMAFNEWLCLMLDRQKKIDIDKACEWLKLWFMDSKYYTPQEVLENFRKAMEE